MESVQRVESIAKVHFPRRRIPNARRKYWPEVSRICVPAQHHQVGVKNLLRIATFKAQAVRQVDLAAHPIASDRGRHRVVEKDKRGFLYLLVHIKPVVWFATSNLAAHFNGSQLDLCYTTGRLPP